MKEVLTYSHDAVGDWRRCLRPDALSPLLHGTLSHTWYSAGLAISTAGYQPEKWRGPVPSWSLELPPGGSKTCLSSRLSEQILTDKPLRYHHSVCQTVELNYCYWARSCNKTETKMFSFVYMIFNKYLKCKFEATFKRNIDKTQNIDCKTDGR